MATEVTPTIDPKVAQAVEAGQVADWSKLAAALAPAPVAAPEPSKVPLPMALSDSEVESLSRLPEVYGSVVPDAKRELSPDEVTGLLVERATLKDVEKAIKRRMDDISLTVLNHSDSAYAARGDEGEDKTLVDGSGDPLRNKAGHIVRKTSLYAGDPAVSTRFSVEPRSGTPSIDLGVLKAISEDEGADYFSHEDWLSMTTQTRVFDEAKALLALRKNPALLRAVQEATKNATPVVSVYQRNVS